MNMYSGTFQWYFSSSLALLTSNSPSHVLCIRVYKSRPPGTTSFCNWTQIERAVGTSCHTACMCAHRQHMWRLVNTYIKGCLPVFHDAQPDHRKLILAPSSWEQAASTSRTRGHHIKLTPNIIRQQHAHVTHTHTVKVSSVQRQEWQQ